MTPYGYRICSNFDRFYEMTRRLMHEYDSVLHTVISVLSIDAQKSAIDNIEYETIYYRLI